MTKLPEPTEIERQEISAAKVRRAARGPRFAVAMKVENGRVCKTGANHTDAQGWCDRALDTFGTSSSDFVCTEIARLGTALHVDQQMALNAGLAVISGARPKDEIEAQLVSQMHATHALAMDMVGKAKRAELLDTMEACSKAANRALRCYALQVEALTTLRRGGKQIVEVQHVYRQRRKPGEGGGKKEKPPKAPIAALEVVA